ncbi:hypothetical protein Bealeia2_01889 (plasmid) [Candidatus Bealeia paramacronuclearis]|nr:hypothetical protein [Candidatus Bealeia paramacronuclearis]
MSSSPIFHSRFYHGTRECIIFDIALNVSVIGPASFRCEENRTRLTP